MAVKGMLEKDFITQEKNAYMLIYKTTLNIYPPT